MRNYTEKDIKDFKAMGYEIDSQGNLVKETKLQKTVRTKEGIASNQALSKMLPIVRTNRNSTKINKTPGSVNRIKWTRSGLNDYTELERLAKGLVTQRQPGIEYNMLTDGTKVCRSCQNRKPSNFYSNDAIRKDGKNSCCKDCDYLRAKSYKAEKKNDKI